MAETYFPFDAGAGANTTEDGWAKMARLWLRTGVLRGELNALAVSAPGSGMTVNVATGRAFIEGFFYENDAIKALAISAADPTNPRIDRIVVRLDRTANTMTAMVITGTPAGSPVAPAALSGSTQFDVTLGTVLVGAAVVIVAADKVTDLRSYAAPILDRLDFRSTVDSVADAAIRRTGAAALQVDGSLTVSAAIATPSSVTAAGVVQGYGFVARPAAGGISSDFSDSTNSRLFIEHPASGIVRLRTDPGNSLQFSIGGTQYALLQTVGLTITGGIGATGGVSAASLAVTGAVSSGSLSTGAIAGSTGTFSAAVGIAAGFALNADFVAARGDTGAYLATNASAGIEIRGRTSGIVPFKAAAVGAGTASALFSDDVNSTLTVTHPSSGLAGLNVGGSESLALTFGTTPNLTAKSDGQAISSGLTDYATNLWVRYRKDYGLTPAYFHEQVSLGNDGSVPSGYRPLCVPA